MRPFPPKVKCLFFDCLIGVLIFFPLLTGGVWIRRPGLFLELAELAVPVVLVVGIKWILRVRWKESFCLRTFKKILFFWQEGLKNPRHALCLQWGGFFFVGLLWSLVAICRHYAFRSGAYDLTLFVNTIWNFLNGNGYFSSIKKMNLFLDHQSPVLLLFGLPFSLISLPETLLVSQAFLLALGGVFVYWIGQQYTCQTSIDQKKVASFFVPLLPLLYWCYLPIRNTNRFDFHPEIMMLPAALGMIYCFQERSWKKKLCGVFFLLLVIASKESSSVVLFGIGLSWVLGGAPFSARFFTQKMGLFFLFLGPAILYWDTRIIPQLIQKGEGYAYQGLFSYLGSSWLEILVSPFLKPGFFFAALFEKYRLIFLLKTLGPLAFLPLLSWRVFISAVIPYVLFFLVEGNQKVRVDFHYIVEPGIGIFWALAATLGSAQSPWLRAKFLKGFLLFCCLFFFGRSELYWFRFYSPTSHQVWLRKTFFPHINPNASLLSTWNFTPHLALRQWIDYLPILSHPPQKKSVDCILWDHSENQYPMNSEEGKKLFGKLKLSYRSVFEARGVFMLQSRDFQGECLDFEQGSDEGARLVPDDTSRYYPK